MLLDQNIMVSISKQIKHIRARYEFIKDHIYAGYIVVARNYIFSLI